MENRYTRNEEFQEEDIWGVVKDSDYPFKGSSYNTKKATRIMIPKFNDFQEPPTDHHHSSSAPVNIPDWSKIYGTTTSKQKSNAWLDDDQSDLDRHGFVRSSWESDDEEEEEDEDDDGGDVIPPHELIARKLARNQISSFSVFEGAGRTLKGRDLSRVRNAVLTKTGFLESKPNH